ncbi:hypothetical protein ACHAW5_007108 [Stephanodiscus triporus]|uniref:AB hydrolase-1 domain-containing protein n=1 Tax=Stephanodiscus triporus TaxID=2934178 RepID=A0ABD3NPE3_9STRA
MLGWGLSSRPRFNLVTRSSPSPSPSPPVSRGGRRRRRRRRRRRVPAAEAFFIESLERWRAHHDIQRLTLAGHSMGGYLATAYTERHPDRVHRLILLSPVGVPRRPVEEEERWIDSLPFYARYAMKAVRYLFEDRGITPGNFLRSLLHGRSRAMVDSYVNRRIPSIACPDERDALGEYLGEYCLGEILMGGAYAKSPLVDRIRDIVVTPPPRLIVRRRRRRRDWMDYPGGGDASRGGGSARTRRGGARREELVFVPPPHPRRAAPRVHVHSIRDAGHLLMLDNHEEFGGTRGRPAVGIAPSGELGQQRG